MGVDAQMFVRHPGRLSPAQVRKLSSDLSAAFWREPFMIWRPGEYEFAKKGRHALQIIEEFTQDAPSIKPEKGEQFIEVHLSGRYYGEGYERGDWPTIYAVARWLRSRIPDSAVWYGGDSSGVEAQEMDGAYCDMMWDHFIRHGHSPYVERDNPYDRDRAAKPTCSFCTRMMHEYGWGGGKTLFSCASCGYACSTKDKGATFEDIPKGEDGFGNKVRS